MPFLLCSNMEYDLVGFHDALLLNTRMVSHPGWSNVSKDFSLLRNLRDVHIQACLFWFVPSHLMARSKLADPNLANFPAICTVHSYVQGTKRGIVLLNLAYMKLRK